MPGGMLPFNQGIMLNHQALWIDLNIHTFLLGTLPTTFHMREYLPWKNKKWEEKAKIAITKALCTAHVEGKLNDLLETTNIKTRDQVIDELEQLDALVYTAILAGAQVPQNLNIYW